jgi:hypothetical protein
MSVHPITSHHDTQTVTEVVVHRIRPLMENWEDSSL